MAVKIRLQRGGSKKRPFYRIVATDSRMRRDGRFLERLGSYNPMLEREHSERVVLNEERIRYWLSKGAQPTDRVALFLAKASIIDAPVVREQPKKSAPGEKAVERAKEKEEKRQALEQASVEQPIEETTDTNTAEDSTESAQSEEA